MTVSNISVTSEGLAPVLNAVADDTHKRIIATLPRWLRGCAVDQRSDGIGGDHAGLSHKWDKSALSCGSADHDQRMTRLGGRRQRRNWRLVSGLCALGIVASVAYAVRQIGHGGLQPSDTAGVLGLPLGVAGLAAALIALRKPVAGNDAELARGWAKTLALQVESAESAVFRQLLGDDTRRINLTYLLYPATVRPAAAPAAGRLTTDGSGAATLPDIVTYYRDTQPLRLVVTGAAGAGKTVLALELLLALIAGRADDGPVPVRISLSRWDSERQSLPNLLEQHLVDAYDWPADLAATLVRHGLVLPVLDGLDEMDATAPDGSPDPAAPGATAVVHALNAYQRGRDAGPLILTCRTHHYDALTPHTQVLDAARISIAPVDTADARNYLNGRALDAARWRPLTDRLDADPSGPLATVLSTPWRLCLTATVYHQGGDPGELCSLPDPDALDRYLLARYIPAATRLTPAPHGYAAHDVHRWLHHLATRLDPAGTLQATVPAGAEATDLVLHELWPLAGRARVRAADALLTAVAVLIPLPLVWAGPRSVASSAAAVVTTVALLAGMLATRFHSPRHFQNPFRSLQGRRIIAACLAAGPLVGMGTALPPRLGLKFGADLFPGAPLAVVLSAGAAVGLTVGVALGLVLVLIAEIQTAFGREPETRLGARALIRRDALFGLAIGIAVWITYATFNVLAYIVLSERTPKPGVAEVFTAGALVVAPALGLAAGLAVSGRSATRYSVFLLCSRRLLPFRLGRFLDWAVDAGLLRYSGSAYQYRHRELQHWLRRNPLPPFVP